MAWGAHHLVRVSVQGYTRRADVAALAALADLLPQVRTDAPGRQ